MTFVSSTNIQLIHREMILWFAVLPTIFWLIVLPPSVKKNLGTRIVWISNHNSYFGDEGVGDPYMSVRCNSIIQQEPVLGPLEWRKSCFIWCGGLRCAEAWLGKSTLQGGCSMETTWSKTISLKSCHQNVVNMKKKKIPSWLIMSKLSICTLFQNLPMSAEAFSEGLQVDPHNKELQIAFR